MAILHSCCCWRSVRRGSFAAGIHTVVYYSINSVHSSVILKEELDYILHNSTQSPPDSFLNHDTTSPTSVVFTLLLLIITSLGVVTSILLLYGLYRDIKYLLLPWIINIIIFTLLDLVYITYNFIEHALKWNPSVSILVTIDFFITCLNVYALLCVISQYQELKAGRGRAADDQNFRIPNIQYSSQPTATSCMSTIRKPLPYQENRPTPTQSPTGTGPQTSSIATDDISPSAGIRGPRKSVKFPDHSSSPGQMTQNGSQQHLEPWCLDAKSPTIHSKGGDTAPLIESVEPVLQTSL